jgi:NAD(P)-dependent dehydrogenase (short-subunit alcohol dehydrogenase family)
MNQVLITGNNRGLGLEWARHMGMTAFASQTSAMSS